MPLHFNKDYIQISLCAALITDLLLDAEQGEKVGGGIDLGVMIPSNDAPIISTYSVSKCIFFSDTFFFLKKGKTLDLIDLTI